MKKRVLLYCAITLMVITASLTVAPVKADHHEVTIKGEVVDQPCYEGKGGARGDAHRTCAINCAKRGSQLAIVEDGSSTVYSITGDYAANKNEKLIEFVTEMVEAKGTVTEKDGKKWVNITSIKKLEKK